MAQTDKKPAAAKDTAADTPQLSIQKVYVKDLSFEAPGAPGIFLEKWTPSADIRIGNHVNSIGDDLQDVILTVTVTVKSKDKSAYVAEVQQGGIFKISGVPEEQLKVVVATACPNILFPYAREAISDAVTRGGFPQMLLAPVNFDALYAQQLAEKERASTKEAPGKEKPH